MPSEGYDYFRHSLGAWNHITMHFISNWVYENSAKHFDPYHPYFTLISPNFKTAS